MTSRARAALLVAAVVIAVASVAYLTNPVVVPGSTDGYERTTFIVVDDETGETLTAVNARVADTRTKRFTDLSDTEPLAESERVWFIHDSSSTCVYVIRDMDFPLDTVFTAENGATMHIHHAELDPEGTSGSGLIRCRGAGKYVLELPYDYMNETEIDAGDRVEVE